MGAYRVYQTKVEMNGFKNYVYIIVDKRTKKAAVIDPSWDYERISSILHRLEVEVTAVLLTHLHIDHSYSAHQFVKDYPECRIYLSQKEYEYYGYSGEKIVTIDQNQIITVGATRISCLVTPGHTKGSVCYWLEDILFTGDTIFTEGCGICDGAGGDAVEMYHSIQMIKRIMSPQVRLYAAHSFGYGQGYTMEEVSKMNIYFQIEDIETFVQFRNRKGQNHLFKFR